MARCAHRALLACIGIYVFVSPPSVREIVDVRQREVRAATGAAGSPAFTIKRGEPAVCSNACFDMRCRRWPVAGIEMLFLAIEHELYRNARGLRQFCACHAFAADLSLAAETAAHVLGNN